MENEEDDIEVAAAQRVPTDVPDEQRPPLIRQKRMPLKLRALRLSQQVTDQDYQKYLQYKSVRQSQINPSNSSAASDMVPAVEDADGNLKIDLAQITALLLIPKLRKLRDQNDNHTEQQPQDDIVDLFLAIVLKENNLSYGQALTPERLARIVSCHTVHPFWAEKALPTMMESLQTVGGPHPRLDKETRLRVLTHDILSYKVDLLACTHETPMAEINALQNNDDDEARKLKRIYMASFIDNNADTYRNNTWAILTWYVVVTALLAYMFRRVSPIYRWKEPTCGTS
jgi:hypothetical protein